MTCCICTAAVLKSHQQREIRAHQSMVQLCRQLLQYPDNIDTSQQHLLVYTWQQLSDLPVLCIALKCTAGLNIQLFKTKKRGLNIQHLHAKPILCIKRFTCHPTIIKQFNISVPLLCVLTLQTMLGSAVQRYLRLYKLAVHLQAHSLGCILGPSCCCVTSCLHPGTEATFDLLAEKPKRHSQKHNIKKPLCDGRDKVAFQL